MRRDVFQAIADPTRRAIINMIAGQHMNLNAVAERFDISRPAISKQIKILTQCGLVTIKQQGRERYCQAKLQKLNEVSEWVEKYRVFWNQKLDALEEFLAKEMDRGNISKELFTSSERTIKLHGHCQQKAWNALKSSIQVLSFPKNYKVKVIPSGCCGMAGSFGYEKEHYAISMQIGELVLFPSVREQADDIILAAPGTSCRHQIKDGTSRKALHPVEILYEALVEK